MPYAPFRKVWLFLRLVWREWEPGFRIPLRTAWKVAGIWDNSPAQKRAEYLALLDDLELEEIPR